MLLSIIIPVYNTSAYVTKCIESILSQPWTEKELIIVNDGSTDNSLSLLKEQYGSYHNIRILSQNNGGLSSARNTGLTSAKGELITFVDSDDFLAPNTYTVELENIFETEPHTAMVVFPYAMVDADQHILRQPPIGAAGLYSNTEYLQEQISTKNYSCCNKIFRRKNLQDLLFPVGKNIEDLYFMAELIPLLTQVRIIYQGMYYYLQNNTSITKSISPKMISDLCDAADRMEQLILKLEIRKKSYLIFLINTLMTGCRFLVLTTSPTWDERLKGYLQKIPWHFHDITLGWKKNCLFVFLKLFGIHYTVHLFRHYASGTAYKAMFS